MTLSYAAQATFTWDIGSGLPQVLDDGAVRYIHGIGRIAQVGPGTTTHYYLADGLSSTMALVDASGAVVNTFDYDVFGAVRSSTGTQANAFTFTGEQTDASTGLEYLRARYYDRATGRFVSKDPLSSAPYWPGYKYSYGANNPLLFIDPSGLCLGVTKGSRGSAAKNATRAVTSVGNKAIGCASNIPGCALDATNFAISESGSSLGLDDLGHVDVNLSGCLGVCLTVGVQASFGEGIHPYGGGGIGTPQAGVNVTVAPGQHIAFGWNCGVQGSVGSSGLGPSGVVNSGSYQPQNGHKEGGAFFEIGGGYGLSILPVNISYVCVYIF